MQIAVRAEPAAERASEQITQGAAQVAERIEPAAEQVWFDCAANA